MRAVEALLRQPWQPNQGPRVKLNTGGVSFVFVLLATDAHARSDPEAAGDVIVVYVVDVLPDPPLL